jgi:DNA-binding transcriptional MerR regulator
VTEDGIQKLYYSISEISRLLEIDQHVLRFWETEFKELAPRKNSAGNRLYKESELQLLKRIKHLLYEDRYTIEGAKRQLKMKDDTSIEVDGNTIKNLQEIKKGLQELSDIIDTE